MECERTPTVGDFIQWNNKNDYKELAEHQILNKNKALQENGKENHALLYAFPIFQGIDKRLTQFPYPRSMTPSLIKPSPIPN